MAFVDMILPPDARILKKLTLEVRSKKTGKIYPVKRLNYWDENEFEAVYKTEEEQIREHVKNGGHYCSSCGDVFYDEFFDEKTGDLIIKEIEVIGEVDGKPKVSYKKESK